MSETELARAERRLEEARARVQALKNREAQKQRKLDTRRKVILGGALVDLAERDDGALAMVERLLRNLSRDIDRKAFEGWAVRGVGEREAQASREVAPGSEDAPGGADGSGGSGESSGQAGTVDDPATADGTRASGSDAPGGDVGGGAEASGTAGLSMSEREARVREARFARAGELAASLSSNRGERG